MAKERSSVRQAKLRSVVHSAVSEYFLEHRDDDKEAQILVEDVIVSPDLKAARVWISFSPHSADRAEIRFERAQRHLRPLQSFVFERMPIKRVPEISLVLADPDATFRIHQIFDTLRGHEQAPTGSHSTDQAEDGQQDSADDAS